MFELVKWQTEFRFFILTKQTAGFNFPDDASLCRFGDEFVCCRATLDGVFHRLVR